MKVWGLLFMKKIKTIIGFEQYAISESGEIFNRKTKRQLKFQKNLAGYHVIMLRNNNKSYTKIIHRLVYETWIGKLNENLEINHIDGNKENNHYTNLEQITHQQNCIKAVHTGCTKAGMYHPKSKVIAKLDSSWKIVEIYGSIRVAARINKINYANLCECVAGKRKKVNGFYWVKY